MHCLNVDAQVNHEILDHFENCWTAFILCNRKYCTTAQGKLYAANNYNVNLRNYTWSA